jgi:uncharacterized protein Yka (UPF0111/DUF47 family)
MTMHIRRSISHWFLPHEPDVLGALQKQMAITVEGMAAFADWAAGEADAAQRVRRIEHEADDAKRDVRVALRDAFITPISPEDIFILSQLLDKVLTASKDVVRESEVMDMPPDEPTAEMAGHLCTGTEHLARAFDAIAANGGKDDHETATAAADDATKSARRMEKVYRQAMSSLLALEAQDAPEREQVREVMGRRELYRRMSRIAGTMVDVADRVWYAAVKEL